MRDVLELHDAWLAGGASMGRAVVLRTYGSAPRPEGAVLLCSSDGRIAGSVSGGCVEAATAQEIRDAQQRRATKTVRYGITDEQAWNVGLACGGTIDVLIEPEIATEILDAARAAEGTVVVTPVPGDGPRTPTSKLVFDRATGLRGTTGDVALDSVLVTSARDALLRGTSRVVQVEAESYFLEVFSPRRRMVIVGAVEIARPLVTMGHELGYEMIVVDGRAAFATHERFPDADRLLVGWIDEIADEIHLSGDDAVVVLTHDAKFDEPAIREALRRGCRYVGAIGSKKTQAERRTRLNEQGVKAADLARLHGPIGLDLGGRAPAETALAILAEIVADRYGATAGSLRERADTSPPVHAA